MNNYKERYVEKKESIDNFFNNKQHIGIIQKDGSVLLSSEEILLLSDVITYQSAQLLKAKLKAEHTSNLNKRGIDRKKRNDYALASTISYIVNQKFDSNMAKDPNYTPTLAEEISLTLFVTTEQFRKSLKGNEDDSDNQDSID